MFWDYDDFVKASDLPEDHAWARIAQWHDNHVIVYDDAVTTVKRLHSTGLPLYIISNNPIVGCLLMLQRAGLATLAGTPWFSEPGETHGTNWPFCETMPTAADRSWDQSSRWASPRSANACMSLAPRK